MDYIKAKPFKAAQNLLLTAVINSRVTEVIRLIEDGEADINGQNVNGSTALHAACQYKLDNVAKVLLDYGADPSIKENLFVGGKSPIHLAVENDCYNIVRMLLDKGCSPNVNDGFKNYP
jgi:ankyrin repeat protein